MRTYPNSLWVLLLAAFAFSLFSALSVPTAADEPYLVKEFTLDQPGTLMVETSGGNIKVMAHESNKVRVEMRVLMGGRGVSPADEEARELLEGYTIDISQAANTISALAKMRTEKRYNFKNKNHSISFTVYVPRSISAMLHTSGGAVHVEGVEGEQEVRTSGGNLSFKRLEGNMKAHTSGGSISIENYSGTLDARTSGGTIKLADSKGNINIHTSGGNINIENASGSIEAFTSGGNIKASLLTLDKQLKLITSGGNIKAVIPAGLGLDLDLKGERVKTKLQNFNGQAEEDRIKGSMNGGGIQVVMSTSGGNVDLEYQ